MQIRAGYEISYACAQATPMIAMLSVYPSRQTALITPDLMRTDPAVPAKEYVDGFGSLCHVIHAPAGNVTLSSDFLIHDGGSPDVFGFFLREYSRYFPDASLQIMALTLDSLAALRGDQQGRTGILKKHSQQLAGLQKEWWGGRLQCRTDAVVATAEDDMTHHNKEK